jgi:Xaa-Pro dipeptidase
MINHRFEHLNTILEKAGLDAVAINPGPTFTYLTGMNFGLMERPTVLLYSPSKDPVLVLPELEMAKVHSSPLPIQPFAFGDNPGAWHETFSKAASSLNLSKPAIGVEPTRLRVLELRYLEDAFQGARFISADAELSQLRIQKDEDEVKRMRKAVQIAEAGLKATIPSIKAGISEREIAAELTLQLLQAGSDSEMPFSPIVSSGPNSANPHASPSDRKLTAGDLLVIDWGAAWSGYIADLTRTFAIQSVTPEFEKVFNTVKAANQAGRNAARPGIPAGDIDRAARKVIEDAGYGPYFTHRVGHGIGMEGHEAPYMFAENTLILQPGMAFTVEPGIYLPNRNGVRIEDNVVITAGGAETLSSFPRELTVIG